MISGALHPLTNSKNLQNIVMFLRLAVFPMLGAFSNIYWEYSTRNSKFQNFPKYFTEVHLSSKELAYTSLKYVAASRVWSFAGLKLVIPRNNIFGAVGNVCKQKKSKYVVSFFVKCAFMIVVLA